MPKKNNSQFQDIPLEGSLGLLALGAVGIRAWKKKREESAFVNENKNFIKVKPEAKKDPKAKIAKKKESK
ncbi:MAG: hypothetical protein WCT23_01475 [Candidatus Neomarinimicrobiota bacterium]